MLLVSLNAVCFDERGTIEQHIVKYIIKSHARLDMKVHKSQAQVVDMKPSILRQIKLDEILIFMIFVLSHVNCESAAARLEVIHHDKVY